MKIFTLLSLSLAFILGGCGDDNTSSSTDYSYAGAGTKWSFTLKADGTFTAEESTYSVSIAGTFSRLSTGFVKLSITS